MMIHHSRLTSIGEEGGLRFSRMLEGMRVVHASWREGSVRGCWCTEGPRMYRCCSRLDKREDTCSAHFTIGGEGYKSVQLYF